MNDPRPEGAEPLPPPQDTFRKVYFGPLADPLIQAVPEAPAPEAEDELTRAALEDPEAQHLQLPLDDQPTLWRLVVLILFAIAALGIVFVRR